MFFDTSMQVYTLNEIDHGDDNILTVYVATKMKLLQVRSLVPSMIASYLFLSTFSCTVGILIGFLVYRSYVSKKTW